MSDNRSIAFQKIDRIRNNGGTSRMMTEAVQTLTEQYKCFAEGNESVTVSPLLACGFVDTSIFKLKGALDLTKVGEALSMLKIVAAGAKEPVNARALAQALDLVRMGIGELNMKLMLEVAAVVGKADAYAKERVRSAVISKLAAELFAFEKAQRNELARKRDEEQAARRAEFQSNLATRDALYTEYAQLGTMLGEKSRDKGWPRNIGELMAEIAGITGGIERRKDELARREAFEQSQQVKLQALLAKAIPLAERVNERLALEGSTAMQIGQLERMLPVLVRAVAKLDADAKPFVAKGGGAVRGSRGAPRPGGKKARKAEPATSPVVEMTAGGSEQETVDGKSAAVG